MSKILTSPVKRFAGSVTLHDPLTFPQYKAWNDGIAKCRELGTDTDALVYFGAALPGICACVESWNIAGQPSPVTPDTFNATPRGAALHLISWLINEITEVVKGEEEIPNA